MTGGKQEDSSAAGKAKVGAQELIDGIASGRHYGCILLEGEEEYTKRQVLNALEKAVGADFPEMNIGVLYDPPPDALIAAAETVPFMSGLRLVIVRESSLLSGKVTEFDEEAALKRLEEYLPHVPHETTVVFVVRGKADGKRRMKKILQRTAVCVDCSFPEERAATEWLRKKAKEHGRTMSGQTASLLVFTVGQSLDTLSMELDKLIDYTDERGEITESDVRAICTATREARVFELTDALLGGDGKQAFLLKRRLLMEGEEPLPLLSLLSEQCRRMYYGAEMRREGKNLYEIAQTFGVKDFLIRKALQSARNMDPGMMKRMCAACTDTEYRVKSGQINDDAALESMMLRILQLRAISGRRSY